MRVVSAEDEVSPQPPVLVPITIGGTVTATLTGKVCSPPMVLGEVVEVVNMSPRDCAPVLEPTDVVGSVSPWAVEAYSESDSSAVPPCTVSEDTGESCDRHRTVAAIPNSESARLLVPLIVTDMQV